MNNDELLHKWIKDPLSLSQEELLDFQSRPEYQSLTELYSNTENITAPGFEGDILLDKILSKSKAQGQSTPKINSRGTKLRRLMAFSAAACLLCAVSAVFLWPSSNMTTFQVASASQSEFSFPDGSVAILNANSKVSFDSEKWNDFRKVNLDGEAFFKVKKGAKFIVETDLGNIEVLGTEFNVKDRKDVFEVICTEGKVKVYNETSEQIITANEAVKLNKKKDVEKTDLIVKQPQWMNGLSQFKNASLGEVVRELERQYDVQIIADGIDLSQGLSCNFQHKDLDNALQTTVSVLNIKYRLNSDKKTVILAK